MSSESNTSSFIFKFVERFAVKAIGLVVNIMLARLLMPDDYGLLAIVNVFVNLAHTFVQTGMGTSLVQNQTTKEDDYSTVFFLSFGSALFFTVLLFLLAPVIASLYHTDAIIWPLRVMAFSLLFSSFNVIQTAKLQRAMKFKTIMQCNLISSIVSGAAGILSAWLGLGIWALVIHSFSHVIVVSLCMYVLTKWRPHRVFSLERAKIFFGFGWKLLASGLICSLYYDIRALIIGYRYSTTDLAYYNKAQQYPDLFARTMNDSVRSVSLPIMSRAQDSREELVRLLVKTQGLTMFLIAPTLLGLASVADTLIPVLLTDKWLACIPYMIIFCLGNLSIPLVATNTSLLTASGNSGLYMKVEIIRRVVMLATLLITVFVFDSVMAIAIGYAIGYWLDALIVVTIVRPYTGVGLLQQLAHSWKTLLASAVMAVIVYGLNLLFAPLSPVLRLVLQILAGVMIFFGISLLLRNEILLSALQKARRFLRKK